MAAGAPAADAADRFRGYTEHESLCGSKTTECHKCGKYVLRRDLEAHAKLHMLQPAKPASASGIRALTPAERAAGWAAAGFGHDAGATGASAGPAEQYPPGFLDPVKPPAADAVPRTLCATHGCARAAAERTNALKACTVCWGRLPLLADQSPQALVKSLVKAYFVQLSKGCGSERCTNALCAVGSPAGPITGNAAAAAAVKLAQETLETGPRLCLRNDGLEFANDVAALGDMGFPREWASLALERMGSQRDAAVWLLANYAPPSPSRP